MLSVSTAWGENPALSYRNLRAITGYVGLTLPVVLLLDGVVDGHIETSLILLGGISLFIFPRDILPGQRLRANWYMALGALIWLSIILMPALNSLAGSFYDDNHVFFILETVCVMAFAVSFILKGHGQPSDPRLDRTAGQPPAAAIPLPWVTGSVRSGT